MLQPPPPERAVSFSFFFLLASLRVLLLPHHTCPTHLLHNPLKFTHSQRFTEDYQAASCMFARSGSSPMAPSGNTKQTLLDSYSRPTTRLARKEAGAKGPIKAAMDPPSRPKLKKKVTGPQGTSTAPESDHLEDNEPDISRIMHMEPEVDTPDPGQAPKCTICSAEEAQEGRIYLEEEALINPGEHVDMDAMAGTLVQVSLLEDIPAPVSLTVRAVALILAQMKTEFMSETLLKMMELKIDLIVGKVADKLTEMEMAAEKTLEDL